MIPPVPKYPMWPMWVGVAALLVALGGACVGFLMQMSGVPAPPRLLMLAPPISIVLSLVSVFGSARFMLRLRRYTKENGL